MTPDAEADRRAAQEAMYNDVLDSPVTKHAIDFLCRTQMLLRITDDKLDAAAEFLHSIAGHEAALREYEQLNDDDRDDLHQLVVGHWSLNVNLAVRKMWHAAEVLGFQADTLDPKHVAMVAATYFSMPADDLVDELTKAAK
jgi:hypothetical protein